MGEGPLKGATRSDPASYLALVFNRILKHFRWKPLIRKERPLLGLRSSSWSRDDAGVLFSCGNVGNFGRFYAGQYL